MKKIIVLGSSPAGISALETIREQDQESELTLFALEDQLPISRFSFSEFLNGNSKENRLFIRPADFYKKQRINLVLDRKISRISFKRKKVTTDAKEQLDYDVLLIGDLPGVKLPDLKGTNKEGVYSFRKWKDVKKIASVLPLTETIAVQAQSLLGLQAALALRKRGREVLLIVPTPFLYQEIFDLRLSPKIYKLLTDFGIRLILDNPITEVLGDSECKAIRLKSGKVLACQMVIFSDAGADFRFFTDDELNWSSGIPVDPKGQTSQEDVYALDDVSFSSEKVFNPFTAADLVEQGRTAGTKILGGDFQSGEPVRQWSFLIGETVVSTLGETKGREGWKEIWQDNSLTCQKLYLEEQVLKGAVLINAEEDKPGLLEMIQTRRAWPDPNDEPKSELELSALSEEAPELSAAENPGAEMTAAPAD